MQRDMNFPVWTNEKVAILFMDKKYESREISGKWLVSLDPAAAGGPHTMEITCGTNSIHIEDIYIGDVWLCSGQSNMEMQMQRLFDDYSEEWEFPGQTSPGGSALPVIRQFKVPQDYDFSCARDNLTGGSWLSAASETLHEFTATGWFFAKNMYKKYGIPVALISTAWGGTPVESWMSADALKDFPEKIANGRQYAAPEKRSEISKKTNAAVNEWETRLKNEDTGLKENWQELKTDISKWSGLTLPGYFSDASLAAFCGVIWLSKDFDVSADFAGNNAKIWLGTITDADIVFINGKEIGSTGYRYPPRKYVPRGLLKKGKNRIVIRVTCNNGEGGVTSGKPFRIFTESETVELSGTWKYKIGAAADVRPQEFFFQRQPMGNFNAMIAPVLRFPLKGVIWYQGESNDSYPHDYEKLFQLMIRDWRKKYSEMLSVSQDQKQTDKTLPFFFVQLPIWKEASANDENSSWAVIRDAQRKSLCLPQTGMAAALDLGEWNDLHPINKKDVGFRLFLAAEKLLAGVGAAGAACNTSPGPLLKEPQDFTIDSQSLIYLSFDNCGDGLCVLNDSPVINITTNAFLRTLEIDEPLSSNEEKSESAYVSVITDKGQVRLPAEITAPDTIRIDLSTIKNPKVILYAWADNPRDRQLFNSEGLPVIPFKIDINSRR